MSHKTKIILAFFGEELYVFGGESIMLPLLKEIFSYYSKKEKPDGKN